MESGPLRRYPRKPPTQITILSIAMASVLARRLLSAVTIVIAMTFA